MWVGYTLKEDRRRGELYMNFGVIHAEGKYSQRGVIVEVDSMS